MGSPFYVVIANFFMEDYEEMALKLVLINLPHFHDGTKGI
jgi:hypothetical protein